MEAVSAETSRGAESSRMSQTTAVTRQGNRIFVEAAPLPSFRRRGDGQARVASEKFRHQRERSPKTWTSLRRCSMSWDTDCQSMYVRVRICYAGIEAIATGLPVIFFGATEARFSSPEEAGHRSSNTGRAKAQAMRELQQLGKKRLRRGDLVDRRKQTWTQPKA